MYKSALLFLFFAQTCFSAPVDGPIKVDLPVYNQPEETTVLNVGEGLQPENHPGGEPLEPNGQTSAERKVIAYKLKELRTVIAQTKPERFKGPFAHPDTTLETAIQETEGYGSKLLSVKETFQNVMAKLHQPRPIVDTISESEKYGNTGDKFYTAGKAIVGGAEGASNFINSILEVPGRVFEQLTRAATAKLNNFGGKLIGL